MLRQTRHLQRKAQAIPTTPVSLYGTATTLRSLSHVGRARREHQTIIALVVHELAGFIEDITCHEPNHDWPLKTSQDEHPAERA